MMRRWLLLVAAVVVCCAGDAAASVPGRALWVWSTKAIREDPVSQAAFFEFLGAPRGDKSKAITTVFFDSMRPADFQDAATVAKVRSFLSAAHSKGVSVDYLCGDPSWATLQNQPVGLAHLSAVLDFNAKSPKDARFDGFQFDVEPYSLPGWPSVEIRDGLLDLLDKSNAAIKGSGQRLKLALAIPRWFGKPELDHLDQKVIDRTDEVDVMDYVTTSSHLVGDPASILDYASEKHKIVRIGVETGELKETPKSTFFGIGNSGMEAVLDGALPDLMRQRCFAGYAIHDYVKYKALAP